MPLWRVEGVGSMGSYNGDGVGVGWSSRGLSAHRVWAIFRCEVLVPYSIREGIRQCPYW
jgi:hypothetical protein